MGSKKKKQETESSSSSSDSSSEASHSSTAKRSKPKTTKRTSAVEEEPRERKQRRSSSVDKRVRDDGRVQEDHDRYHNRRSRHYDYNNRSHDGRYTNRRPDFKTRDRRHDRNRDYRDRRQDNRSFSNRDRDRNSRGNRGYNQRRRSRSNSFDHANAKWGRDHGGNKKIDKNETKEKQKPNFGLSGKLTEETNTFRGVVIKYSEPPEARKPKRRWRLYPFKGEKALQTLYIHRESAYLIGRDRKVVDLAVDHPSCSKQHAALQYRLVPFTREDGSVGKRVRPYLIDLNSANGTYINNKKIEVSKYVELLEKDVVKFGFSSREYVLLHENSKDETQDDDVKQENDVVAVKNEDE